MTEAIEEKEDSDADEMSDLLICLGQEEAKCQGLSEKLASLGVDVEAYLATIVFPEEDEDNYN